MGLLSEKTTNRFLAIRDAVHFIATLGLIVGVVGVPYIELKLGYYNTALEKLKILAKEPVQVFSMATADPISSSNLGSKLLS